MSLITSDIKQTTKLLNEGHNPNGEPLIEAIKSGNETKVRLYIRWFRTHKILGKDLEKSPLRYCLVNKKIQMFKLLTELCIYGNHIYYPFSSKWLVNYQSVFNKIVEITPYIFFNDRYSIYTIGLKTDNQYITKMIKKAKLDQFVKVDTHYHPLYVCLENKRNIDKMLIIDKNLNTIIIGNNYSMIDYCLHKRHHTALNHLLSKGYKEFDTYKLIDNYHVNPSLFLKSIRSKVTDEVIDYCIENDYIEILMNLNVDIVKRVMNTRQDNPSYLVRYIQSLSSE